MRRLFVAGSARVLPLWGLPDLLPNKEDFPPALLRSASEPSPSFPAKRPVDAVTKKVYHKEQMRRFRLRELLSIGVALWLLAFPASAQGCSVRDSATGRCSHDLFLTWNIQQSLSPSEIRGHLSLAHLELPQPQAPDLPNLQLRHLLRTESELAIPTLMWTFGTVGELQAHLQNLDALVRSLLEDFFKSEDLSKAPPELTLLFSLDGPLLFWPTQLQGRSQFSLDDRWRLFLSRATVTLRTELGPGNLMGEIELDPKTLGISREKILLEIALGATALSTTFERGLGLTSQVYAIRAQIGSVQLIGQATFASTFQEFKIGATIAGLALSGSSLITAGGVTTQSLFIEIPIKGR